MLKNMKIGTRIILVVSLLTVLIFTVTIGLIVTRVRDTSHQQTESLVNEMAGRYGGEVKAVIEKALNVSWAASAAFVTFSEAGPSFDRNMGNEYLKKLIKPDPRFYGITVIFRPNKLDGKDADYVGVEPYGPKGEYGPYAWKENGQIQLEDLSKVDPETTRAWYIQPRDTGRPFLTEPYTGVTGAIMSTISVPMLRDGEFLGVVGIDFLLDEFKRIAEDIRPMSTGRGFIISNQGMVVAHPNPELVGKTLADIFPADILPGASRAVTTGTPFYKTLVLPGDDDAHFYTLTPVIIDGVPTPWAIGMRIPESTIWAESNEILVRSLVMGLIAVIFIVVTVVFIARSIRKPLEVAVNSLQAIGQGDLTRRMPVTSRDEIGQMGMQLNETTEKIESIMRDITTDTLQVDDASRKLSDIAGTLSGSARETSVRCDNVAAAAREMSDNITSVVSAIEESSANASTIASAAEEMTATIGEIARNMDQASGISQAAVDQARNTVDKMSELGAAALAIGQVTDAISNISEQINLLSLNATIEAARAGEAGRGFAVVANETKELAGQAANATQDIHAQIEAVQSTANQSIEEIDKILSIINEINGIISVVATSVDQQTAATQEIADNITQSSLGLDQVNQNINQSSAMVGTITQDISQVSTASAAIADHSGNLSTQAEELHNLARKLEAIVSTFKIS